MGAGSWSDDDYTSYTTRSAGSRAAYAAQSVHETFKAREMPQELDPAKILLRESCDSTDNPLSTPIIMALDVTGSMGQYANRIATEALPQLMTDIYEQKPVTNPHMMFMGIDDVHARRGYQGDAPLQVSQFEADIRILDQLSKMWIVGGGGANRSESYDLAWYFAGHKTKLDCFDKRGAKGFLFTLGDEEAPYENLSASDLRLVFGDDAQVQASSPQESLAAARKQYHVFHVVIEQGNHYSSRPQAVRSSWGELMGTSVLFLKDFRDLGEVVTATMRIVNGEDINTVIKESKKPAALRHAFDSALKAD